MPAPVVTATSLVCPVGLLSATACAAMRAGLRRFEGIDHLGDDRQPIVASHVLPIGRTRSVRERLRWLLARTLGPLFAGPQVAQLESVALLFAFVERPRRGADDELARALFDEAVAHLGERCAMAHSGLDYGGAPAGFRALERARQLLAQGQVRACIVCGLDSWIGARSLLWLGERVSLRTVGRAGLIPGEAGAALLLAAPGTLPTQLTRARLRGLGFGVEPSAVDPRQALRGEGLRDAVAAALRGNEGSAPLGLHELALRMSDDAGTHAGSKEQMLLLSRLLRVRVDDLPLWLPAESIGHVGAATGLVQIVWATEARARGYLPGPRVLCTTSSLSGERAAAIVELPDEEGAWT